jgi:hypothetical protein
MFFRNHSISLPIVAVTVAMVSACEFQRTSSGLSPTSPVPTGGGGSANALKGRWVAGASGGTASVTSPSDLGPISCANLVWNANDVQDDGSVQGAFTGSCTGGYTLSGSATGTLSGDVVVVRGSGAGDLNGTSCPFTLSSDGVIEGNQIRFPYTATTCQGTYTGTTFLARTALPIIPPPSPGACGGSSGDDVVECVASRHPERLAAGVSHDIRVANMAFLRDWIIEQGRCKGLDLAWNLKRGVGPHSIDALAWRTGGQVEVVDIGVGYDDTSQPLQLQWLIVAGPPGYDPYTRSFSCN